MVGEAGYSSNGSPKLLTNSMYTGINKNKFSSSFHTATINIGPDFRNKNEKMVLNLEFVL